MATFNTYSKEKNGLPDILIYDEISEKLKNQIYFIWKNFFNQKQFPEEITKQIRKIIYDVICEETGKKSLYFNGITVNKNPDYQVENYFSELKNVDEILNVIHITFHYMKNMQDFFDANYYANNSYRYEEAVSDLNERFKENGVGYELVNGKIIQINNKLLHIETIENTILLINNPIFQNVNEEFLKANEHFRHKRYQESINECLKAFESTMKIICDNNGWIYDKEKDTSKNLIGHLFSNNFFKNYHENHLRSLKNLLESNIPTIRNKNSGHGQGVDKRIVSESLVKYVLYSTGATINLLVETYLENIKNSQK